MNKKNIVYSAIGGLASCVVIINLFSNIDNKSMVDIKDFETPKGGYEYVSIYNDDEMQVIDGYRISLAEVESRVNRGNTNIMKFKEIVRLPSVENDNSNGDNTGDHEQGYSISNNNKKYSEINNGVVLGFSKANSKEVEVNIASSVANHTKYLRLPLDSQYMNRTSPFGVRKDPIELSNNTEDTGSLPFHTGLDLAAEGILGKPIYTVSHGQIKRIQKSNSGYGNLVVVDHGSGFETYYAHMSEIDSDIREGDLVSAGTVLGKVGSTGRSTGPHLHFEANINGVAINPELIISLIGSNDLNDFVGDNNSFTESDGSDKLEVIIDENIGGKFTPIKFKIK